MIVAGTGHRPDKLGGYDNRSTARVVAFATKILAHTKPTVVISGMALGWDQALAHAAVLLGISFHAYIPFEGMEIKWPSLSQDYFNWLREQAAHEVIVCEGGYAAWKMQARNESMVDALRNPEDKLLALHNGSDGGTFNCIQYAMRRGKFIDHLWNQWTEFK